MATERPRARLAPPVLLWAFAFVAAAFLGSTIYSDLQERSIDTAAADVQRDAIPSVERLIAARTELRRLEVASDQFAEESLESRDDAQAEMIRAHEALDRALMAYLTVPLVYGGEREAYEQVTDRLAEMDTALDRVFVLVRSHKDAEARGVEDRDVRGAVEQVDDALQRLTLLNARAAHDSVAEIARVRARTTWLALGLDALCLVLAVFAATIATRAVRRQARIERAHAELLEHRADELELFAKRVAHDLLSPLSALSFSLALVKRNADRGQPVAEPIARAGSVLKRAQRLVDGVFDFARAGSQPRTPGKASLREAIEGVLDEVRTDETETTSLDVEPFADVDLACSAGVLTSILSNLVRNAVKYMGERPDRRVTIRATPTGALIHVEVEDTGPGIPEGLAEHVFEPYVRGPESGKLGLGLGLSTVRRFVEAHGGRVGVRPASSGGAVFWFELPRANGPDPANHGHAPSARSA